MRLAHQGGLPVTADDLVTVARLAATVWCWPELLRQAETPGPLADALPAGVGGWMDEGMLSRWLLASYPPLPGHLAEIMDLVRPGVGRQIRRALEALGLPISALDDGSADSGYSASSPSTSEARWSPMANDAVAPGDGALRR
jgi:hypothetical protein